MLPIDWSVAVKYAKLVQLAESIPAAGDDDRLKLALTTAGYTHLETLYGNELATAIGPHADEVVSFGFLALSPALEMIVAIRESPATSEWLHDAAFLMMPSPVPGLAGMTEDGMAAVYKSLRTDILAGSTPAVAAVKSHLTGEEARDVTVCGHGMGGALATLLAADIALNTPCKNPAVYTYASPRTGDHLFAGGYNASVPASYRIVNRHDLVPQLPATLPLPYEHVNTQYELNPPFHGTNRTLDCMHRLTTYIWLMQQRAGSGGARLDGDCR